MIQGLNRDVRAGKAWGQLHTYFFACPLSKSDICPPNFVVSWNDFWSCPTTFQQLPTPLLNKNIIWDTKRRI